MVDGVIAHQSQRRHSAVVWIQFAPHLSDSQVAAIVWLSTALLDSSVPPPLLAYGG